MVSERLHTRIDRRGLAALLGDDKVFTTRSLEIMKRMKDYGGQATCTQLAVKYGETKNFYLTGSTALAKRVVEKTGCPVLTDDKNENSKWWPVLYIGRYATKDEQGSYIWKLRDELSAALDKVDLSGIELYVAAAPGEEDRGYWWLNANPKIWSYSDIAEVRCSLTHFTTRMETSAAYSRTSWKRKSEI